MSRADEITGISVEVIPCTTLGWGKCLRCRKYTPEAGYDAKHGCVNLLCNRCEGECAKNHANHPAYVDFVEERRRVFAPMVRE